MENELMLQFVDRVIKKAGLDLDEDFLNEYREVLLGEIEKRIWLMAVDELKNSKIMKFAEITEGVEEVSGVDESKKNEIINFCKKNISNFEEKVLKVMDDFGKQFVKDVKMLQ